MIQQGYEIDISSDSVELKHDGTTTPLDERIVPGLLLCGFSVVMLGAMLFLPGKHGHPSVWDDLHTYHWPSGGFQSALVEGMVQATLFGCTFLLGFRQFFPSGEELHCDRSTFMIAKIPWYNLVGRWHKETIPTSSVSELTYALVSSRRGGDIYGLSFYANSKEKKIFRGIQAPEADKVIKGLKNLGVNVIEDQDIQSKVEQALRERSLMIDGGI